MVRVGGGTYPCEPCLLSAVSVCRLPSAFYRRLSAIGYLLSTLPQVPYATALVPSCTQTLQYLGFEELEAFIKKYSDVESRRVLQREKESGHEQTLLLQRKLASSVMDNYKLRCAQQEQEDLSAVTPL